VAARHCSSAQTARPLSERRVASQSLRCATKCKHAISLLHEVTQRLMRRAGIATTASRADTGAPLPARTGHPQQNSRVHCRVCVGGSVTVRHPPSLLQPLFRYLLPYLPQTKLPSAGQVVPVLNSSSCHEGVWGSEVIDPCILNIDDRFTLQPTYPREEEPFEYIG
jgi:hypothetical protein